MARKRRQVQQRQAKTDAQLEHEILHNQARRKFIEQKLAYIKEHLHLYEEEQDNRTPENVKLLTFKDPTKKETTTDTATEEKKDSAVVKEEKSLKFKQRNQVIQSKINKLESQRKLFENVQTYVKKKLLLDETTTTTDGNKEEKQANDNSVQVYKKRREVFKKQFQDENNLYNLNYLPAFKEVQKVKQVSTTSSHLYSQWFTYDQDYKPYDNQYNWYVGLRYAQYVRTGYSIMRYYSNLTTIDEYLQNDDYTQTSLLENNTPTNIFLQPNITIPLQLLATTRFLLTLKSYNTVEIQFSGSLSYVASEEDKKLAQELIEVIVKIILKQRQLQYLKITIEQSLLDIVTLAMSQQDLENSQVRVFIYSSNGSYYGSAQQLDSFFSQISRFKKLSHFQTDQLTITKENKSNFEKILKNLHSADLNIKREQVEFDSPNLRELKVHYTFLSTEDVYFQHPKIKNATNLNKLTITRAVEYVNTNNPCAITSTTTRKDILQREQQQKREAAAKLRQEQGNIFDDEPEATLEETEEVVTESEEKKEKTPLDVSFYSLECFLNFKSLKNLHFSIWTEQKLMDSLTSFLKSSTSIETLNLTISQEFRNIDCFTFNMNDLYPALNQNKSLQTFDLSAFGVQIKYYKPNLKANSFNLALSGQILETCSTYSHKFDPLNFTLDKVVKLDVNLTITGFTTQLERLDTLCKSISQSKNIEKVNITFTPHQVTVTVTQYIEKNEFKNQNKYKLFTHNGRDSKIEILALNIVFINQSLIDQLGEYIKTSQNLKAIQISRQSYRQYYLDYTSLFKGISQSKSLEQLHLFLNVEQIAHTKNYAYISVWQETKINIYYKPFAEMLLNSSNQLIFVEFDEATFTEEGYTLILRNMLKLNHQKYIKFNANVQQSITQNYDYYEEEFEQLAREIYEKGMIVNSNYQFQHIHKFSNPRQYYYYSYQQEQDGGSTDSEYE